MSGPLTAAGAPPIVSQAEPPDEQALEISDAKNATVGRSTVRRTLPRRGRRTVGAWCFADEMGPETVTATEGLDIGPHPHIGLHTVTWLLSGAVLHRDSLGSEQLIRPGQLNLMTAGAGVAHAEESSRVFNGTLHGVQLWVAQPEATRNGPAAFEHHAELPRVELGGGEAMLIIGSLADAQSPARADTDLVGAELQLSPGQSLWPLRADFEHAIIPLVGTVAIGDNVVAPGQLGYLGAGRSELPVSALEASRLLLLGGVPFPEPIVMWWNFVARTKEELAQARTQWATRDDRFPDVTSELERIAAPPAL